MGINQKEASYKDYNISKESRFSTKSSLPRNIFDKFLKSLILCPHYYILQKYLQLFKNTYLLFNL